MKLLGLGLLLITSFFYACTVLQPISFAPGDGSVQGPYLNPGTILVNPAIMAKGQNCTITWEVAEHNGALVSGITLDASSLGITTLAMNRSAGTSTWTRTITIPQSTMIGEKLLSLTVTPSASQTYTRTKSITISSAGSGSQDFTGYYERISELSGAGLKSMLHTIINENVTRYDYSQVWTQLEYTDEDPTNTNNVIQIYTGWSIPKANKSQNNENDYWNREHVWAKSHGDFGEATGPGTDLHHLRPLDKTVNSTRNNLNFDNGGSALTDATPPSGISGMTGCSYDSDSFEPRSADKGDVARMMMYMAVMYEGSGVSSAYPNLELNESTTTESEPYFGKLSTLLTWSEQDPPSDFEKERNTRIFERQGNRNPFIDHPELANMIW